MSKKSKIKFSVGAGAVFLFVGMITGIASNDGVWMEIFAMLLATVLHECGHLLAAKVGGVALACMKLDFLGARIHTSGMISYSDEWFLCAGGPLVNLISSAAVMIFSSFFGWRELAYLFVISSLCLATLNLLPIESFDGGRMLYCLLAILANERVASFILRATSFLLILLMWLSSVYILLHVGNMLSLFVFSLALFCRMISDG